MASIVKFPDGNHFSAGWASVWNSTGAGFGVAGKPNVQFSGYFISTEYTYTGCPNSTVADRIITLLDEWMRQEGNTVLDIAQALGVVIFSLSPDNGAANTVFSFDVVGQQFTPASVVTVAGAPYPTEFVDTGTLTVTYNGPLDAGAYDVAVSRADGTLFVLPQSFTLI